MSKANTCGNTKKRGYPEYLHVQNDRDNSSAEALQMLSRNIIDTTIKTEKNSQIPLLTNDIPRFQKSFQPQPINIGNNFLPLPNSFYSNYTAFPLLMSEKLHNVNAIGEEIVRLSSITVDIDRLSDLCLSLATEIREIHIIRSLQLLDPIRNPNATNLPNARYPIEFSTCTDPALNKINIKKNEEDNINHSPEKHKIEHACELCRATCTPEWRRGPTGRNTLCNACGLRYAKRLRADMNRFQQSPENTDKIGNKEHNENNIESTKPNEPRENKTKKMDINSMIN